MSIERLAFDHLVEKLNAQRTDIMSLRRQASVAAAITGLVATFFSTAFRSGSVGSPFAGNFLLGFSLPAVFILVCVAGSLAFSTLVVIAWRDFTFAFNTEIMIKKSEYYTTDKEFLVAYIKDGEWFFGENEKSIAIAQNQLLWAMILGWAQIVPWLIVL